MAQKEIKGGELTNQQVEQDLKARGKTDQSGHSYIGIQDTGDHKIREEKDSQGGNRLSGNVDQREE